MTQDPQGHKTGDPEAQIDHNFDEYQKERKNQKLTFKKHGEVYEVPQSPPASVMFNALEAQQSLEDDKEIPASVIMNILKETLGDQVYQLKEDCSWPEIEEIFRWIWTKWRSGKGTSGQGGQGKAGS